MIKTIIELYRLAIGAIFVVGVLLAFISMSVGDYGMIMGLGILGVVIMTVGISALLISINDHLAAIRGEKR